MRPPEPSDRCWVDGRPTTVGQAHVAIEDPAALWGLGVFETLARHAGRPVDLDPHLERLALGARRLRIPLPPEERLREVVDAAAHTAAGAPGWIKIVVTRGGRWFVLTGAIDPRRLGAPATCVLLPWRRCAADPLVSLKTLNHAGNRLGLELAGERGADEGLWLNTRGHLAEGCTSNVFVVDGGRLFTPGTREGILPGIVRATALRAARGAGVTVHEGKVRPARLARADEAFLTSSVLGVRALVAFEGRPVGVARPGPVTRRLAREVARLRGVDPGGTGLTTGESTDKL